MEAYTSIVAGGENACCLHYHANNCDLKEGDLLLIDAGCQYQYYASDVTRTFPIGRKFSAEQRAVYEAVLDVQLHGIALSRVGSTMQEIHEATCKRISERLVDLKLLSGSASEVYETKAYRKYFPHGTGHWLGMDVHDVGDYTEGEKPLVLKPGMVFTVEPGIYIPKEDQDVPENFRGVGVRIEDDVVITSGDAEVLTAGIPKKVSELEDRY
jgi:Xaa-Pro aminopeptidase